MGRAMSKQSSFSPSQAAKAALGTRGWIGHPRGLLESEAWRGRSIHAVRVLDRLELEHLLHAGKENGFLTVTHRQFVEWGLSNNNVRPAIDECVHRGLIRVTHQGSYAGGAIHNPSKYQLNYLAWKFIPAIGAPQYMEPTNEWKNFQGNLKKPRKEKRPSQDITARLRKRGA
jgi:hypothetical protein